MASLDSREKDTVFNQLVLVNIIKQYPELFDKSQRPEIRDRRRKVLEEITEKLKTEYGVKCNQVQVLKKIHNMKGRIKKKVEMRMAGNNSVKFKPWEKELYYFLFGKSNLMRAKWQSAIKCSLIDKPMENPAPKIDSSSQLLEVSRSVQKDNLIGSSTMSLKTGDTVDSIKQNHAFDESDGIRSLSLGEFPLVVLEQLQDMPEETHEKQPDGVRVLYDVGDSSRVGKEGNLSMEADTPEQSEKFPSKIPRKIRPLLKRMRKFKREGATVQAAPEITDLLQHLDRIVQNAAEDKPYDQFGKYVADELRQLPPRQAILLQQEIQNCITHSRLSCLGSKSNSQNEPDSDVLSLSSSDSSDFWI